MIEKAAQLTTVDLVRVVMAIVISVAAPQFESAAPVTALKLVGFAG